MVFLSVGDLAIVPLICYIRFNLSRKTICLYLFFLPLGRFLFGFLAPFAVVLVLNSAAAGIM